MPASAWLPAGTLVEVLCVGAHAVGRASLESGTRALVIGAGPIGLSVMAFARLRGAEVIALDVDPARLEYCRSALGIQETVIAGEDAGKRVEELTGGDRADIVFDATGSAASMKKAMSYVAHGGRLVLVGLVQDDLSFSDPEFHKREMTLLSSRNALMEDFEYVIRNLEEDQAEVKPFITHRAAFDKMIETFPKWLDPDSGVVKAVVNLADHSSG